MSWHRPGLTGCWLRLVFNQSEGFLFIIDQSEVPILTNDSSQGKFCHNPDTELGENIFSSWSSDPAALAKLRGAYPVDSWYSEVKMFK